MSNFLKYMRLFALGITFSSSMALPYVQIKFYDVFREATQASNYELGLLMTIFTAVSMALYIPGGVLADRGSPKKLLLLSLIMMRGLNAYFAFHTSYGAAQLIWALLAIAANTVQWPTLIKAIRDTGSSEEQGRMFGTFYGTTGIFSSIIGFVGAWIYSNGSSNIEGFHLMLLGQSAFSRRRRRRRRLLRGRQDPVQQQCPRAEGEPLQERAYCHEASRRVDDGRPDSAATACTSASPT